MSAPITASDPAVRYRFWLTEGRKTREFERRVPVDVMMDLENHPTDQIPFLRRALADPRFSGHALVMEPL